jgi:putative endonuclease
MNEPQNLGQMGENLAVKYLEERGYRIRHRNWRSGKNEIDIIAENIELVVFVEVKTRTTDYLGDNRDLISADKQKIIIYVANSYINRYDINKEGRFDVIIVVAKGKDLEVEQHIENAFYPTLR